MKKYKYIFVTENKIMIVKQFYKKKNNCISKVVHRKFQWTLLQEIPYAFVSKKEGVQSERSGNVGQTVFLCIGSLNHVLVCNSVRCNARFHYCISQEVHQLRNELINRQSWMNPIFEYHGPKNFRKRICCIKDLNESLINIDREKYILNN